MRVATGPGPVIGVLILSQMIGGTLVNFVLAAPLFGSPGFLVNAAQPGPLGRSIDDLGLLWEIIRGPEPSVLVWGRRRLRSTLAPARCSSDCVVSLAIAAVEQISVMSMLSLSEAYAKASAAEREPFQLLRIVVASARNWSHYIELIFGGSTIFVLYTILYRFALVPRALAAFGLAAVLLQLIAVAMPLFGTAVVFPMLAPLGVSQLLLALWLVAKGFRQPANPIVEMNAGSRSAHDGS